MQNLKVDQRRWMRYALLSFCGVFLINWGYGAFINPYPLDLMEAKAEDLGNKQAGSLAVRRGGYEFGFLGHSAYCEFESKGEPGEGVFIEVRKRLHLLPWQVTEYRTAE